MSSTFDSSATSTGYAEVDGLRMYYETHGSGHPLVLLHGGLLTIDGTFGPVLPRLTERHRAIGVELQGHGRTADSDRELTFERLADDVVALLDQIGVERTDLFGFSLGGLVSLQLAMRHPDRLNRLILAAAHYRREGYHDEILNYEQYANPTRMPTQADFQSMFEAYARLAPEPGRFEQVAAKTSALVDTVSWTAEQLRAIRVPILLIVGDTDFVRLDHAVEMHELIPDARLAVLPDTRHMDVMQRTDLVVPLVESFLSDPLDQASQR